MRARTAILLFAEAQQRDLRRRGLASRLAPLLALPRLQVDGADLHWFTDRPSAAPVGVCVHRQQGRGFSQRLQNAIDALSAAGYEQIVIVGRDCPQLTTDDISRAIELLVTRRLVIGPDHRGGCWLIGFRVADRARLRGVTWQHDTDARQLRQRFNGDAAELEIKFDIDHTGDLALLARHFAPAAALLGRGNPPEGDCLILLSIDAHLRRVHQLPPPTRRAA